MTNDKHFELKAAGLCSNCRQDRGKNGTETLCRSCADKGADSQRRRRIRLQEQGICIACGKEKLINKNYCLTCTLKHRKRSVFRGAKSRAKAQNLSFDLIFEDLEWPDVCPILGIPLEPQLRMRSDNSPSLDRLIPELGYVKGNVHIISDKANRIKNNATLEELHKIVNWVSKMLDIRE